MTLQQFLKLLENNLLDENEVDTVDGIDIEGGIIHVETRDGAKFFITVEKL